MRLLLTSMMLLALSALATSQQSPSSSLYGDPETGLFTFCTTSDCDSAEPSITFSIAKILVNASTDTVTQEVTSSAAIADFEEMEIVDADGDGDVDSWITGPQWDGTEGSQVRTMYARGCMSHACAPRTSNAAEYERLMTAQEDAIGIKLEVQDIWERIPVRYLRSSLSRSFGIPTTQHSFQLTNLASSAGYT